MNPAKILVIGSANMDLVVKAEQFPDPGETILGGDFKMFAGGKGANQAVAAARMGGDVTFICKLGDDVFGKQALEGYQQDQINTEHIIIDPNHPSGVALINVNNQGENKIVVASGANDQLTPHDILSKEELIHQADIILTQLETPINTLEQILKSAWKDAKKVIVNPAPAAQLPQHLYPYMYVITPNEKEIEYLTQIRVIDTSSAREAALVLLERGVQHVVITRGSKGVFYKGAQLELEIPALEVQAIDTTGAGDTFNGALAVFMKECDTWEDALTRSVKAASLSVTKMGAQDSIPERDEVG